MRGKEYYEGFIAGLTEYAWWQDGIQHVGSCGTTLKTAVEQIKEQAYLIDNVRLDDK